MPADAEPSSDAARRARLAQRRERTAARLASLRRDHDRIVVAAQTANIDDEHDPEGATIAFEREQVRELIRQAEAELTAIDAAEQRLDEGTAGTCASCGRPIGDARLEARPTTTTCVGCAG